MNLKGRAKMEAKAEVMGNMVTGVYGCDGCETLKRRRSRFRRPEITMR